MLFTVDFLNRQADKREKLLILSVSLSLSFAFQCFNFHTCDVD